MSTYLITGVSGYIGESIAEKLLKEGNNVIAILRDKNSLSEHLNGRISIIEGDIRNIDLLNKCKEKVDYIIHGAAPTQSAFIIEHPVETSDIIINGMFNILNFAKIMQVKSIVFLSSMEVYGRFPLEKSERVIEEELGELNIKNIRNSYPHAKRIAENICYSYYKEYNLPIKIARLSQVFGKKPKLNDNRIFAQFVRSVKDNNDIVLHTLGESMGNYCDIDDAVEGIDFLLKNGLDGEIYNIVNEDNTMTIREMAEIVVEKIACNKIKLIFDIPETNQYGYAEYTNLRLSGEKMKSLGWVSRTGIKDMYSKML